MKIREINDNEMKKISGGDIGSTLINAIGNAFETLYKLGVELGSGIRRIFNNSYCNLD